MLPSPPPPPRSRLPWATSPLGLGVGGAPSWRVAPPAAATNGLMNLMEAEKKNPSLSYMKPRGENEEAGMLMKDEEHQDATRGFGNFSLSLSTSY